MKKVLTLAFLVLYFQVSFSQVNVEGKYKEAVIAYKESDFERAISLIIEIKPLYKTVPPKVSFVEIMAKAQFLKADPLNNFSLLENIRYLTNKYLKDNSTRVNSNYRSILAVRDQLSKYPKDQLTFNLLKAQREKEEIEKKEMEEKAEADLKEKKLKAEAEAKERKLNEEAENKKKQDELKAKQERDRLLAEKQKLEQAERERLAQIEKEEQQKEQRRIDSLVALESEKQRLMELKKQKKKLKSFTSLGFQSGEIAKYGLLLEIGGKTIGFRMVARSSITAQADVLNEIGLPNKTEVEIGPNIKILKWFYINLDAGYGYYNANIPNEYAGTRNIEKIGYVVTSGGIMIRLNRIINVSGGASFMDINKDVYKPEITVGISFNLRKNRY